MWNTEHDFKSNEEAQEFLEFLKNKESEIHGIYNYTSTKPLSVTHPHYYVLKHKARKFLGLLICQRPFEQVNRRHGISLKKYNQMRVKEGLPIIQK